MARARRREPGGRVSSRTCISKPRSQVLRRHSSNLHSTHPLLSPSLGWNPGGAAAGSRVVIAW
eukprot:1217689-Prymnesium_polylepis.1